LEQKYEVCLLAWKNNHKVLAIEILESIIYDSGFRERSSNPKADLIIRQANKFLGFCYLTGDGIQKNVEKAVMYFKKSDTTDSLFLLGIIYFSGYIEKEDAAADNLRLAEKWFKMAAERGHLSSQIMLLYLMYMEEEQSINKQRERNVIIDESGLDELNFMFNDESLQKVSENVKRINHNILNNVINDKNSNLLAKKSSNLSLGSTINNSPHSSTHFKTTWSNDTRSLTTVVNSCGNGSDGKSSYNNPHYNYSFSSGSNIPHSVNKKDFYKLNRKLSMETINNTNQTNNFCSTSTFSKYLINNYGGIKSSFDITTQTRHRNILYWLKKAANHKNVPPFIFFELGYYYQNGIGAEKNLKQATHWYQCLVDREAEYIKQYPWINNNILYAKYQLARLAPSASKSIDWLLNAANDGNAMAQTCLGQYYFEQNSIQHKMQQYIVKHAKEFDASSIFGKKLKSFDSVHMDNLQHMEGFQHFFNNLVEILYKQDQQNERNYNKELIPDVEFLNNLEIKKEEKISTFNYSYQGQKEKGDENLPLNYLLSAKTVSNTTNTTSNTTNTVSNATTVNSNNTGEENFKKPSKLFKKFTLNPFDSIHIKTTHNTENVSTPKISVKRNKKIKSFRELKKSLYNRLHSKNKKSANHSNSSVLSSPPSVQPDKSIISVNKRNSVLNNSLDEKSYVTAHNESRLTFHYFDKNEVSKSIIIEIPEDKEKLGLTTDLIMTNLSLFQKWNLLDAYKNALQKEIAKFVQENCKLFDKSKKYESKINFSDNNEIITIAPSSDESSRKNSKKEKGYNPFGSSSSKLKKKRSIFNILLYGKNKSKSSSIEDHSQNHQRSYSDNKEISYKGSTLSRSASLNTSVMKDSIHSSILTKSMENGIQLTSTVPQDDKVKMGLYWLSSAANGTNNNDGPYFVAQYILGSKYENGKQVVKNVNLSIFWLKRALEKFTEENINSVIINEAFNNDIAQAKEELDNVQGHHRRTSSYGIHNKYNNYNLNRRSCPAIDESILEDVDEDDDHEEENIFQSVPASLSKSIKKGIKKRGHFYLKKDKNDTSMIKEIQICNALEEDDKFPYENRMLIHDEFQYRNPFLINDNNDTITGNGGDDLIFSDVLTNYKISKNGDKIVKKKMSKFMNVSKNIYSTLSSPLTRSHSLKEGKYGRSNHFLIDTLSKDTSILDRNNKDTQLKKYSSLSVIKTDLKEIKEKNSFFKHFNNPSNDEFNSSYHHDFNGINGTSGLYNAYPPSLTTHHLNHRRSSIVSNINMRGPQDYEAMHNSTIGNISINNDKDIGNYSAILNNTSLPPPYRSRAKHDGNTSKIGKTITSSEKILNSPNNLHRSEIIKKSYHNQPLSEIKEATETEVTEVNDGVSFDRSVEGNEDIMVESEIIELPSPKLDQENNSLIHCHNQSGNRSKSQSVNQSRSLRNKPSKRSIVYDDDSMDEEYYEHSSNYIKIKRKSQSRKEANDLILNTSTLSSKKLMYRKKKRLRSKKTGDANSSRKTIHSFSNDRVSFSGELNRFTGTQRKPSSHSFTHSSFLSYLNEDSVESSFIYSHSKIKASSYEEIYQPISSLESFEASPQRHKLVSLLNNLINLRITEKELKKQRKREERRRLKERTSSSSTMVANDTTPLPLPPMPHPQPPLPQPLITNFSKSKPLNTSPTSTKSVQQLLLDKSKKSQLEAAAIRGSSMLTTYSMFSMFLSSESESFPTEEIEFSNEIIHVNSRHGHHYGKDHLKIRSMEREETSKSTLFSDSNSSWSSSSTDSSFSTSTILTETSNSQPYSLVTSYLSSLSPMAKAEISSSFYSEMEDLFQLVKSKLEASSLTIESDYYSYADIVYQLGLCYRQTDPLYMVKLMYQAAVRGHAKAQYLLGRHFLLGRVIPFSLKFGVHWLTLSADQGHSDALYDLGCLYLSDYSSQYHSIEQGKSYLQLALDHGNLKAKKYLDQLKKD